MKRSLCILLLISMLLSLFGCSTDSDRKNDEPKDSFTFTDDLGRKVSVASTERVGALLGSFAHMWVLAGGSICCSADDAFEDFGLTAEGAVNLGSTHRIDREALIEARPDLVFASSKLAGHLELSDTLDSLGIAVAYFDVGDFEDFLRLFGLMTTLTEKESLYEKYGLDQKKRIDAILEGSKDKEAPTVLVLRASASSIRAKASDDTMLGGMLCDFRCVNIADSDSSLLDSLSLEAITLRDPDMIFFIETGDDPEAIKKSVEAMFNENPLWKKLRAVKEGQVYFMDKTLYNLKPNHRFAEAYERLEKILYEE